MTFASDNPARIIVAFIAALVIAGTAWRLRALTRDGAAAATITGGLLVGAAGWWVGATLVAFFVSSTALSKARRARTSVVRQAKGSRRDAGQVFANGGTPLVLAALGWITGSSAWHAGAIVAIAAAMADTWGTEIGRLSQETPRSIVTFRSVPIGTSGAISRSGTGASVIGATIIAAFAAIGVANSWLTAPFSAAMALPIVTIAGTTGSLLDSLLGATVQERRRCIACDEITEARRHSCGGDTIVSGGIPGLDNDVVNILSTATVAMAIVVLGFVVSVVS